MPRYLVERTFPDGLHIPVNADGAGAMGAIVATNAGEGVSWVIATFSADKTKTSALRRALARGNPVGRAKNGVPVDAIHEVSVLDPYFYH